MPPFTEDHKVGDAAKSSKRKGGKENTELVRAFWVLLLLHKSGKSWSAMTPCDS